MTGKEPTFSDKFDDSESAFDRVGRYIQGIASDMHGVVEHMAPNRSYLVGNPRFEECMEAVMTLSDDGNKTLQLIHGGEIQETYTFYTDRDNSDKLTDIHQDGSEGSLLVEGDEYINSLDDDDNNDSEINDDRWLELRWIMRDLTTYNEELWGGELETDYDWHRIPDRTPLELKGSDGENIIDFAPTNIDIDALYVDKYQLFELGDSPKSVLLHLINDQQRGSRQDILLVNGIDGLRAYATELFDDLSDERTSLTHGPKMHQIASFSQARVMLDQIKTYLDMNRDQSGWYEINILKYLAV